MSTVWPAIAWRSIAWLWAVASCAGQTEQFRLSVDVPQVLLTVTVMSRGGQLMPSLDADAFAIYDEGVLQTLTSFGKQERPATIGLIVDNSGSMTPRKSAVLQAAGLFVTVSHPDDDFFVVHFNEEVRLELPGPAGFSNDKAQVHAALGRMHPDGQTALYDAVSFAIRHAQDGRWEKRALLVISDGGDNASRSSRDEALMQARRLGAPIYAIGIYDPAAPDRSPQALRQLAKAGGGAAFFPESADAVLEICRGIAAEIRSQYTLAFTPSGMGDEGGFRRIRVRASDPSGKRLIVRTREGYYEPGRGRE